MKVHLYGITRMRDGRAEWYDFIGERWGWYLALGRSVGTEDLAVDVSLKHGATVVEFTADLPDPMTEAEEITETMRRG